MGKNRFHKIYIELTNICGLKCSFCPPKINPTKTLSLNEFEHILKEVSPFTKDIALHVLGDPLLVKELNSYLDLVEKYKLKAHLTTTGYFLHKDMYPVLIHKAVKQVNFSLNSFNKNDLKKSFEEYINIIIQFCKYKNIHKRDLFVNLRLWNIDNFKSEDSFNKKVFEYLKKYFIFDMEQCDRLKPFRLENKVLIHFDQYFDWPSINSKNKSDGYCHGASSQMAILVDGTIVPCCLDCDGHIKLGNIYNGSFQDIINSQKVINIIKNFKNNFALEELCKSCTYKHRFSKYS